MGNHGGRAVEKGMTGTAGAPGGPRAGQGSRASPRLWHASGGRSWHLVNGDLSPLSTASALSQIIGKSLSL